MSKSSKRKFEIALPDALLIKKVAQIDWGACFICQLEENNSTIVSPFKSSQYDSNPNKSSYYNIAENSRNSRI